jgi:hypothetical protein
MICNFSIPGISKLYFGFDSGVTEYFYSADYVTVSGVTFNEFQFDTSSFSQKRTSDAKGVYYSKELKVTVPNYLLESVYALEGKSIVIIMIHNNGKQYVTGHEKSFSIDKEDLSNAGDDSKTEFSLTQSSYITFQPSNNNI